MSCIMTYLLEENHFLIVTFLFQEMILKNGIPQNYLDLDQSFLQNKVCYKKCSGDFNAKVYQILLNVMF